MATLVREMSQMDLPSVIEIGKRMHAESDNFRRHPLSIPKLQEMCRRALLTKDIMCFVAETNGEIVGLWAGFTSELWYSDTKIVSDIVLFVDKSHRKGTAAPRLMKVAEKWARGMGAKILYQGLRSGIDTETTACFFNKIGFGNDAIQLQKDIS